MKKPPLRITLAFFLLLSATAFSAENVLSWKTADEIVARIRPPQFPAREFVITDYGAIAGAKQDSTEAIRHAIAACHDAGGGHVVVPKGEFLTGALRLLSNVDLHLAEGATLLFSTDPKACLPLVRTRWEGIECMNYSPLIYAFEQENIAVTGEGTLDGQASDENWWAWSRRVGDKPQPALADAHALEELVGKNTPVEQRIFGPGHFLRPNFFQPYRCRNVLVEGVHFRRSPMWEINPVFCTNVTVRGLDILSHGPNNDGCNPDSSRDVLIERCSFDTGDDCIAIKSGRNDDGRRVGAAVENIVIRDCTMKDGHGGVVFGSEISGDCRNVFVENCAMDSPSLDRAFRFKSNARRGGVIENILIRNVNIGRVGEAVVTIDFLYEEGPNGPHRPVVRNLTLENVVSRSAPRVFYVVGFDGATIDNLRLSHCTFSGVEATEVLDHAGHIEFDHVTIEPKERPKALNARRGSGNL
jgi:polygalacturonase